MIDLHMGDSMTMEEEGGPDLRRYVASIAPKCGHDIVATLAQELRDPDDMVRLFTAESLAEIGPAARRVVPALRAALRLDRCWCWYGHCQKGSWTSTGAIEAAMIQITGSLGPDPSIYNCGYSGGDPIQR